MLPSNKNPFSIKRLLLVLVLGLVMFTAPAAVLLTPRSAVALPEAIALPGELIAGAATSAAGFPVSDIGLKIWNAIKNAAVWVYEHGAAIAFRNMARTFTKKIAYDSANMLASGGQGQTPLFTWKNLGKSISDAGDQAIGSFLDGITSGDVWGKFNICEPEGPGAPVAKLMITIPAFNLSDTYKPISPRCTLSKLKANWNKVLNDPEERKDFLKNFAVVFDPRQSELGAGLEVQTNILKEIELNKELKKLQESQWGGFLPVTQTITEFIKTPAPRVERAASMTTEQAFKEPLVFTGDILADALGIFTNTLAAKLMKRLMQGDIPNPAGIGSSSVFGSIFGSGAEYAQTINATLLTAPLVDGGAVDIISEFSGCPTDTQYAAINNCTIDSKFERALRQASEGNALTVAEAINKGLINSAWVFKEEKPRNVRLPDAWYLSDIKKLRLARILPLGWELAAQKVAGQDISLGDVMAGFAAPASPYYHLIDPNWVLKAPPSQCRLLGPGQILQAEGGRRYDTCVDVQNCIAENDDGTCSAWGYCTREKNIWRFGGDSCEFPKGSGTSPYASCQTFTTRAGQSVSYLQNSLANFDDGGCSGAAGCKWYSTSFTGSSTSDAGRYLLTKPPLYLKGLDKITCDAKSEGCSQFLRLSNIDASRLSGVAGANPFEQVVNKVTSSSDDNYDKYAQVQTATLRSAPPHLNCYDADPKNDSPECKNYLALCRAADVGCELYTPRDGAPAVPGVFGPLNTCAAACVGYQAYKQQPSFFEKNPPAVQYFIPRTAKKCSAVAVGCEEFTNINQNEQREYYSQLRQCIKPGPAAATYFTWVGSDLTGYQLKRYSLKAGAGGAPATTDNSGDCRTGTPLQFPTSDPDCKEFYDIGGVVHYRNLSVTITASADCTRYRATQVSAADCAATGGTVETGKCFYDAIPGEGKKCSATQVGCREFKGPTGNNVKLVFPLSTFGDSDAKTSWPIDATPSSGWKSGTPSNDASVAFGHSFDSGPDAVIYKDVTDDSIAVGQQYVISFWAKKSTLTSGPLTQDSPSTRDVLVKNSPSNNWWQNIKKQWSRVPQAQAQTSPISLSATPASSFNNSSFANSQTITLTWALDASATDEVQYKLSRAAPTVAEIIPLTTRLADQHCKDTAGGYKDNNPCATPGSSDSLCKDNTNTCTPTDYKCTGTVRKDASCTSGDDGFCKNLTDTCDAKLKKCLATGKSCSSDNDCRDASAVCQSTKKRCSGGVDNYRKDQECTSNNYCREPGICQKLSPAPKTGQVTVSLPQQSFTDKGLLPVSAVYKLEAQYRSAGSSGYTAVAPFALGYDVNNPPGEFTITTPISGATNQPLTPTIKWTASPRATKYTVKVEANSYVVSPSATPEFTIPAGVLLNSKTYTVTVAAENNHPDIRPSQSVSFTTIAPAAALFSIISPADNPLTLGNDLESISINEPEPLQIKWTKSSDAIGYLVTVYQEGVIKYAQNFAADVHTTPPLPARTLSYDKDCQISIIAQSAGATTATVQLGPGLGAASPCHTMQPPPRPTLQEPAGGGSDNPATPVKIKTLNPVFRWQGVNFAHYYNIEVEENTGAGYAALCGKVDVTTTVLTTPAIACAFKDLGYYRWRIKARSLHPNPTISSWHYFSADLFAAGYGTSGVGYANLPGVIGSKKDIPVPPEPKGLAAVLRGRPGEYSPARCTDPANPPTITGREAYKVDLSWNAYSNSTGDNKALGFTLYRGLSGRVVEYLGCLGEAAVCGSKKLPGDLTATAYTDSSADINKDGNRIVYQLRAFNSGGESKGVSVAVATPNPPIKPNCAPDAPPLPGAGKIVLKIMVDGQPASGSANYTINNSTAGNNFPTSGLVMDNQAPGDYKFTILSGGPAAQVGAELASLEAAPGSGVSCVGTPCGEALGILQAGQILTITINYVRPPPAPATPPLANLDFVLSSNLTDDWQLYTIGPLELPLAADVTKGARVKISAPHRFVIDNIALQQVTDTVYVNKNSWVMPKDQNGNALCQTKDIGCKAYTDQQKTTYNLTGFSKICRLEAVGCEALVDTRNSDSPREVSVAAGGQTITTPRDSLVYRVYDTAKTCAANMQACQRLGEPQLAPSGQVQAWGDKFIRLDPDTYNTAASPLCSAQQDKCEEYKAGNITHYFKDPGNNVCEYKQLTPAEPYGWYKQGTSEPCSLLANASFENFAPAVSEGTNNKILNSGKIDDDIEDSFSGWNRNGKGGGFSVPASKLYAQSSFGQGYYDGDTIVRAVSVRQAYSGIWSDVITLPTIENNPRYFTVTAHLYVPAAANLVTPWLLAHHAYPGNNPNPINCPARNGVISCHHYDYEAGADSLLSESDKGKWVYKRATIKVDPGVKYLSVGVIVATDENNPNTWQANQEIYVDGISLTEGAAPYAYACPSELSSCKAWREPNLTQKTYYYLDNNKLDRATCNGKVSEKEGCLLFNDWAQKGELPWSSELTYERSRAQDNAPVAPETSQGRCSNNGKICARDADCGQTGAYCSYKRLGVCSNDPQAICARDKDCDHQPATCLNFIEGTPPDANLILKVRRDRVCSEWLSCQTSTTVTDPQTGRTREICYSLGRCNEVSASKTAGQCANWLEPEPQQHPLDQADYVGRDVTWSGQDYSGYSIPGLCSLDMVSSSPACGLSLSRAKACRVYPESDAPFPATVARFDNETADAKIIIRLPGYKDANVCQPGEDCECLYQRAVYKNGATRFYGFRSTALDIINKVPPGITCPSNDADEAEKCQEQSKLKQVTLAQGLRGYCLETDASRRINAGKSEACLSWLPIDAVQGETSIFDDKPEAGFVPARSDRNLLYCLAARGNVNESSNKYILSQPANAGRKVKTISSWSGNPWANDEGVYVCDKPNPFPHLFPFCTKIAGEAGDGVSGTYAADSSNTQLEGIVDHELTFSISLGSQEINFGGLSAIDSISIEVGGPRLLTDVDTGFDGGGKMVLSRLNSGAGKSIVGRLDDFRAKADFNDPDNFLTFTITDATPGSWPFFIRLSYQLREWCTKLAQVVDKEQNFVTNKAWTNRVNPKSTWDIKYSGLGYKYKTDKNDYPITSPYGAVVDSPLKDEAQKEKIVLVHQTDNEKLMFNCISEGNCNDSAGAAYSCDTRAGFTCSQWMCLSTDWGGQSLSQNSQVCVPGAAGKDKYCGVIPACPPPAPGEQDSCKAEQVGKPYMCTGTNPAITIPGSDGVAVPPDKLYQPLQEIFAKIYKRYDWRAGCDGDSGKYCYQAVEDAIPNADISGNKRLSSAQEPVVRAVVRDDKGKVQDESPEDSHYFTLSTVGKNKIFAADPANPADHIIGTSPVTITASFYAYNPNGNQMPLRFVGVDWGDKLRPDKNIQVAASLKNHKPVCAAEKVCSAATSRACASNEQCGDKGPCVANPNYNFGDFPDACIDDETDRAGYFFYTNVYTCSGAQNPNWDEASGACVYEPRVAVRDNWGWWSGARSGGTAYNDDDSLISGGGRWQDYSRPSAGAGKGVKIYVRPKSK